MSRRRPAAGPPAFDLQGHRGARGLLPENTIAAFLHALELGVPTLEMDTVINGEGNVVVSHDHWMSAKICSHPDGNHVSEEEEQNLRIYSMSDREVAGFDCGRRGHPDFPGQRPVRASKPLLRDVLVAVAAHASAGHGGARPAAVRFNIEIKSRADYDGLFHPPVTEFADILHRLLMEFEVLDRTTIQSFDVRALEAVHRVDPNISTSLIVDNDDGLQSNLNRLSFIPGIYSPFYRLVDRYQIDLAHALNIKVIPWTINDEATMRKLLGMGVDGLITDFPDLGMDLLKSI